MKKGKQNRNVKMFFINAWFMNHDEVPSCHSKQVTIIDRTGAVHSVFNNKLIISNRLTSFDRRFTTFPGAVSPRAVCDNRNDWKGSKKVMRKLNQKCHSFTVPFYRRDCKSPLALSSHCDIHSWTTDSNKLFVSHWILRYRTPKAMLCVCGLSLIHLICVRE